MKVQPVQEEADTRYILTTNLLVFFFEQTLLLLILDI